MKVKLIPRTILFSAAFIVCLFAPMILPAYDAHVMVLALINIIYGAGLNFTLGFLGQPNFGQSAMLGIGAYAAAISSHTYGLPFGISLIITILISMVLGIALGYISLRLRGAYFCMVTIAISQALLLLAQNWISLTRGPMGISGIPAPNLFGWGKYSIWPIGLFLLALMLIVTSKLTKSVAGRAWVAIRESEPLAQSIGVNSTIYSLYAYVIGGVFSGIAGCLYAHYIGFVDQEIFAFSWSSIAVIAVVLGGKGYVYGPVLGGLVVTLLPEYLRLASSWRQPIFGLIIILIVLFAQNGLASIYNILQTKLKGRKLEIGGKKG